MGGKTKKGEEEAEREREREREREGGGEMGGGRGGGERERGGEEGGEGEGEVLFLQAGHCRHPIREEGARGARRTREAGKRSFRRWVGR